MASCPTEIGEKATSLTGKNSMVKNFTIKFFVRCQQQQKFFTTNYFHMNIFNNEFFPIEIWNYNTNIILI